MGSCHTALLVHLEIVVVVDGIYLQEMQYDFCMAKVSVGCVCVVGDGGTVLVVGE